MLKIIPPDPEDGKSGRTIRYAVWSPELFKAGQPGKVLRHADELPPGSRVVLYVRVSSCVQDRRGNLLRSRLRLEQIASERGWIVVDVVAIVASGMEPITVLRAAESARANDAVVVAETSDRFLRSRGYYGVFDGLEAWPTEKDWRWWKELHSGVEFYTIEHPDAPPSENRSAQTKRGKAGTGNAGGRGNKKNGKRAQRQRKEDMLPKVLELHREGCSLGQIANTLNMKKGTVQTWVDESKRQQRKEEERLRREKEAAEQRELERGFW